MSATPLFLALSVLVPSTPQELAPPRFDDARRAAVALPAIAAPETQAVRFRPAAETAAVEDQSERQGLTWRQIAHRLGGALLGGWVGYVGSQVVLSDWDKETNNSFLEQRYRWAAAGAVLGVVGSHLFGATRGPGERATPSVPMTPRDRWSYLGAEEIRASETRTAYELIYNTRMQWLVTRGANSVAESPRGEARGDFVINVTPGRDKIIVYMDDVRLGGVQDMREVSTDLLTSAQFLDARQATLRYGGGHAHGAILLRTGVSP